jgi:hypothetical protein
VANYYNPQNGYLHDSTIDLAPGGSITSRQLSTVNCDATTLRRMNHWSGADQNTGFYNLLFNSTDASSGYLIGMSNGPTSLENSSANSGPGMYTSPTDLDAGVPAIGFTYLLTGNGPSTQFLPPYTRSTFLYVGTKADLLPVDQTQGIGLEMNQTKVSLTKLASWGVSFGDPANGWHNPYMPDASIAAIAAKVASDSTYATKILTSVSETVAAGGLTADIVGLWQSNYATASVASAVNSLIPYMNQYLDIWVNYDGKYHVLTSFPKMGAICGRKTSLVSTLLASGTLSSSQKDTAKAFAAVCSSLLWDNDVAPADINTGDGWGTANMPVQWAGWRQTHAFQFASHPLMSSKVGSALSGARSVATTAINSDGILYDGSGYNAALAQGSTLNLTNIQNYGLADVSSFGNWRATCKFVVNLLTPPEPRLGLMRRSFTFGDGGNAVMDYMGTLGTIFSDPTCMWGWGSQGNATTMAHTSLTVPTVIAIDDTAPKSTPSLSGSSFSGLGAMLRTAFNTAQESACMVIGGEWYKDHRHPDNGQVSCYLLRNPIAIDWSPYTGLTNHGAFNHNGVMLESSIGQAWNADSPSMDLGNMWGTTTAANLSRFTLSQAYTTAFTSTSGDVWKRSVRLLAGNPAHPYVHVVDSFSGSNSGSGKVLTWNLMAARSSAVSTPAGSITPVDRYNSNGLTGPLGGVMPSNEGGATPVSHVLGTGPQRFQFTGPVWNSLSSTNSADFDAYINGDGTQAFFIGHWAHNSNTEYRNGSDYQTANGTPYIESQHILRVRGTGGFETLLIPRLKGTAAPTVTAQACGLQIVNGSETTCINGSSSTFDSGAGVQTISTYDSSIASAFGITISGGPAECVKSGSSIACTASGTDPLVRTITPPTGYFLSTIAAVDQSGNIQMYAEGTDATVTFQSSPTAMRSLTLWAPKGGGNARLRVGPLVDGTKPFVTRVSDGASAIVKLAPGTYQAQWVTDLSEGKIFSVTVQ